MVIQNALHFASTEMPLNQFCSKFSICNNRGPECECECECRPLGTCSSAIFWCKSSHPPSHLPCGHGRLFKGPKPEPHTKPEYVIEKWFCCTCPTQGGRIRDPDEDVQCPEMGPKTRTGHSSNWDDCIFGTRLLCCGGGLFANFEGGRKSLINSPTWPESTWLGELLELPGLS